MLMTTLRLRVAAVQHRAPQYRPRPLRARQASAAPQDTVMAAAPTSKRYLLRRQVIAVPSALTQKAVPGGYGA